MISSKNINLRALEEQDYRVYHSWINDPETNYWRGLYYPKSLAECKLDLEGFAAKSDKQISLVIENSDKRAIGLIGMRGICLRSRRAEIWIYIGAKEFWNKKYGQEALSALTTYAFDEMNLHRLWLECDPEYTASVKCYEKVGFRLEGRLKDGYFRHGYFRDTIIMGLVRTDRL